MDVERKLLAPSLSKPTLMVHHVHQWNSIFETEFCRSISPIFRNDAMAVFRCPATILLSMGSSWCNLVAKGGTKEITIVGFGQSQGQFLLTTYVGIICRYCRN
jgi:hypothetical protein